MSSNPFADRDISKMYSAHRPGYPDELYLEIVNFCMTNNKDCAFNLAIDVGCGSGQSTRPLIKLYKTVVGIDSSSSQIEEAMKKMEEAQFIHGSAEAVGFIESETVDLLTVACALHWFQPMESFFKEVRRVLKSGATLAVYYYNTIPRIDIEEADRLFKEFFEDISHGPIYKNIKLCQTKFAGILSPFGCDWTRSESDVTKEYSIDGFVGYIKSFSAWRTRKEIEPACNLLQDFELMLRSIYKCRGKEQVVGTHQLVVMLASKP